MLIPFPSYLGYSSDCNNFPTPRTEEYRYSRVIKALYDTKIDPHPQEGFQEIPWESDYVFTGKNLQDDIHSFCNVSDLDPHFRIQNNFIKDQCFNESSRVKVITLSIENPELTLSFLAHHATLNTDKVMVRVKKNTQAVLNLKTISDETSVLSPFILAYVDEKSTLEVRYWPSSSFNKGILCPWVEAIVNEESRVVFCSFSKDIDLHRITFIGYSLGPHSDISLYSTFSLSHEESADFFVRIYHEAPKSTSNQHINAVAFNKAQMNFNAQIAANNRTEKISAYQMFKGLILGKGARITARPQLDIEYYDLACSHGVSIGKFTPEEIFYLKTRGLREEEIYRILTYGFLVAPFINFNPNDPWVQKIKKKLIPFF